MYKFENYQTFPLNTAHTGPVWKPKMLKPRWNPFLKCMLVFVFICLLLTSCLKQLLKSLWRNSRSQCLWRSWGLAG